MFIRTLVRALCAALTLGMTSVVFTTPATATTANGSRLYGFAITDTDRAAGAWMGSYRSDQRAAYRIDPDARDGVGPWEPPIRRQHLSGVPDETTRRIAWIVAKYGGPLPDRDQARAQAAAVDAAVYALLDPSTRSLTSNWAERRLRSTGHATSVRTLASVMLAQSATLAGPYTVTLTGPDSVRVGETFAFEATVTSSTGHPVPGLTVEASITGNKRVAETDATGTARWTLPATRVGLGTVYVSVKRVPHWDVFVGKPIKQGHSRVIVAGHRLTLTSNHVLQVRAAPTLSGLTGDAVTPGGAVGLAFTVNHGLSTPRTATATLVGPWPTDAAADAAQCAGPTVRTATVAVTDNGTYHVPGQPLSTLGHYRWLVSLDGDASNDPVAGVCGGDSWVAKQPAIALTVDNNPAVGTPLEVTAQISHLPAYDGELSVQVFGPFEAPTTSCVGAPTHTGGVDVVGSGTVSASVPVTNAGYYSVRATLPEGALSFAATSDCAAVQVRAQPVVSELANATAITMVGNPLGIEWRVQGNYPTPRTATVKLYGPFATETKARNAACAGSATEVLTTTVTADGRYTVASQPQLANGFFTWSVQLTGDAMNAPVAATCEGLSKVMTHPRLTATAQDDRITRSERTHAIVKVRDLPSWYDGTLFVGIFGPFDSKADIVCTDATRYKTVQLEITSEGTHTAPSTALHEVGWFTWRAALPTTALSLRGESTCGAEESLVKVVAP